MNNRIDCLDHGFVKLLNIAGPTRRTHNPEDEYDLVDITNEEQYGKITAVKVSNLLPFDASDRDPAQTARISFNNKDADRSQEEDDKLYEYLIRNGHTTPIEMITVWLEMKLPIFLARQFIRHRTVTVNEVSARYAVLPEEWYIPETVGGKATSNKQGQENTLSTITQSEFKWHLRRQCQESYKQYKIALGIGVAPEHARLFLHVNHYTHWVWKQDLHNLMHFLSLRLDSHAQIEARIYAQAIYDLLKQHLPKSMEYFDKYRGPEAKQKQKMADVLLEQATVQLELMIRERDDLLHQLKTLQRNTPDDRK